MPARRPSRRSRREILAIASAAAVLGGCSFRADNPVYFVQAPVDPLQIRVSVGRAIGAPRLTQPRIGLEWQVYYHEPSRAVTQDLAAVPNLDTTIDATLSEILPSDRLNRGFSLGYGDYVVGAGVFVATDDTGGTGAAALVGSAPAQIVVYFQGTLTQDVRDQFGSIRQGYNLCVRTGSIRGVDVFRVEGADTSTVGISITKAGAAPKRPRLR